MCNCIICLNITDRSVVSGPEMMRWWKLIFMKNKATLQSVKFTQFVSSWFTVQETVIFTPPYLTNYSVKQVQWFVELLINRKNLKLIVHVLNEMFSGNFTTLLTHFISEEANFCTAERFVKGHTLTGRITAMDSRCEMECPIFTLSPLLTFSEPQINMHTL